MEKMKNFMKYFSLAMVMIYFIIGILVITRVIDFPFLNQASRLILGFILIIYGIFRVWRSVSLNKNYDENSD